MFFLLFIIIILLFGPRPSAPRGPPTRFLLVTRLLTVDVISPGLRPREDQQLPAGGHGRRLSGATVVQQPPRDHFSVAENPVLTATLVHADNIVVCIIYIHISLSLSLSLYIVHLLRSLWTGCLSMCRFCQKIPEVELWYIAALSAKTPFVLTPFGSCQREAGQKAGF